MIVMTELDKLLRLLHDAENPFRTFRGAFRRWRHLERMDRVFREQAPEQAADEDNEDEKAGTFGDATIPVEREETLSVWLDGSERMRIEYGDHEGVRAVGIRVGAQWWSWTARSGAASNMQSPDLSSQMGREVVMLCEPPQLLSALRFSDSMQHRTRAGRPVLAVDAWPREDARYTRYAARVLHSIGGGADKYMLEIDSERGVLLAVQAISSGEPFQIVEAHNVVYDEGIDDALFVLPPTS